MPDSNSSGFSPFGFTIFALELNMAYVWKKEERKRHMCVVNEGLVCYLVSIVGKLCSYILTQVNDMVHKLTKLPVTS